MAAPTFVQCNACGGIYQPVQADGMQYFHACPTRKIVGTKAAPTLTDPNATAPVFAAIVNRRDENIAGLGDTGAAVMKSEGLGVTPVTDPVVVATLTGAQDTP